MTPVSTALQSAALPALPSISLVSAPVAPEWRWVWTVNVINHGGERAWNCCITVLVYPMVTIICPPLYPSGRKRFCYLWEHDIICVWSGPWTSWINYERQFLWVRRLVCFYVSFLVTISGRGPRISCLCLEGWSSSAGIQDQPLRLWWWRWIRFLLLPLSLSTARSEWSSGSPMDSAALKDALMVSRIQKF